jgi:hypothetical protein
MFNLYLGYKYKHIQLDNGYILNAVLTGTIDEPLKLALEIDVAELYRTQSEELVQYLIDYNTVMYLENQQLGIGYKFSKKHNQTREKILLGKDGDTYLTVKGTEGLEDKNFTFSTNSIDTINGPSKLLVYNTAQTFIPNEENEAETIIYSDVKGSQNMVNRTNSEEVSISSQILENNLLRISLYSSMIKVDYQKTDLVYGKEYKDKSLNTFLSSLLPNFNIVLSDDRDVSYTVELKQNLEILKDLTIGLNVIDNGFDLKTRKPSIKIYDPKKLESTFRATTVNNNFDNPHILSMKENYPTISVTTVYNRQYIREGSKGWFDYSNLHTLYRGFFIVETFEIDLLHTYQQNDSTIIISKTGKDVRRDYLRQNLFALSNRII